ncbi:MAG: DUF5695 domain-containing protein [Oscillospiraceae bacterium]|nr:DUF5695 domain-containing protein [Oscillospiraceae bacterium]
MSVNKGKKLSKAIAVLLAVLMFVSTFVIASEPLMAAATDEIDSITPIAEDVTEEELFGVVASDAPIAMPPAMISEFLSRPAFYTLAEGNIARVRTVNNRALTANHVNGGTALANLTDGVAGGGPGTSWNTWNNNGITVDGRQWQWVRMVFPEPELIDMLRVRWWADGGGVVWPMADTRVMYLRDGGNPTVMADWVRIETMINELGQETNVLGNREDGINAGNTTWNGVFFNAVETRGIQLLVPRQPAGGPGIGASQWEVFTANLLDPAAGDINSIPDDFFMNIHQNVVLPPAPSGGTFTLSNSSNPAALSNAGVVTRGLENQAGTITVTATSGQFTAVREFNFLVLRQMDAAEVPNIVVQPQAVVLVNDANPSATLSVEANVTDAGTLTYQWYSNTTNSNVGGTAIPDATESEFTAPTLEAGTVYYYVVITNTNPAAVNPTSNVVSSVSAVTVVPSVLNVTVRPSVRVMRYGTSDQFDARLDIIGEAPETVTWSIARVEGELHAGTSISNTGLLTLAEDEELGSIIVTATATHPNHDDSYAFGTAEVIVFHVDAIRSPNVYHNTFLRNPVTGAGVTAGANAALLSVFDHTGWGISTATAPALGPADGYSRDIFPGNANMTSVFAPVTNPNFTPGMVQQLRNSNMYFGRTDDANSEFAIFNGSTGTATAAGNNTPNIDFGSEYYDVEIHVGMRLTGAGNTGDIVFRFQDEQNFYFVRARVGATFQLGRVLNGVETIIASSPDGNAALNQMPTAAGTGGWRHLRLTVVDDYVTLSFNRLNATSNVSTVLNRANTAFHTLLDNVSLIPADEYEIPAVLSVPGRVGFRADNTTARWNHLQIASLDTNFALTSPEGMFRIETGANGNLQSLTVLNGRNWGRLQRTQALHQGGTGVGTFIPVELLQNEREQPATGGLHRSLGDIRFNYRVGTGAWQTASTGNSGDSRMIWHEENTVGVDYSFTSNNVRDGIRDFVVTSEFSVGNDELSGDYVRFEFTVSNTGDEDITFRDMSLPIAWNHHLFGSNSGGAPADAYTHWTSPPRNYVSFHGSYIMIERMDGASSKVVMIPDVNTNAKLEYRRFEIFAHDNYSTNMTEEFFIYSAGIGQQTGTGAANQTNSTRNQSYLPNTQLELAAGESSTYGFKIFHINDYVDLHALLYDQGLISAVINPGTVTFMDIEALVAVYAEEDVYLTDITPLPSDQFGINAPTSGVSTQTSTATWFTEANRDEWSPIFRHVEDREDAEGRRIQVFGITFQKLGRNDIAINFAPDAYGNGTKQSVMQFWLQTPLGGEDGALQTHADFIMDNLWISPEVHEARMAAFPPGTGHSANAYRDNLSSYMRDHRYGFMKLQNNTGAIRTGTGNSFACNNSDYEQYYTIAQFLAQKNIAMPVEREIRALELYFTRLAYPMNIQPFGGYVDSARTRTDVFRPGNPYGNPVLAAPMTTGTGGFRNASGNVYREGVLTVKCCWQTNGFRMGGNSTAGAADSAAARGIMQTHDRTYNHLHLVNQFFSMYQIIRNNPHVTEWLESDWDAVDYLRVAGIVAVEASTAMRAFGKMGESVIPEVYAALRYEYAQGNHGTFTKYNPTADMQPLPGGGRTPQGNLGQRATSSAVIADRMRTGLTTANGVLQARPAYPPNNEFPLVSTAVANASGFTSKANGFSMTNPYGSEFWVDNTSEEGVYFLTINFANFTNQRWNPETFTDPDNWQLPLRVVDKMLGWTGMQPVWYHQSTSRPMGNDWWNFQYTVGMQGAALQHWFFNFEPDADRTAAMWSQIYGHSLAPFVGLMMGQPEIQNGPLTRAAASASQLQGVAPNPDLTTQGRGPIGAMWFINQPTRPYEFASPQHSMYAQTGEGGLKLWAGLRILHTAVVPNDPHFGLTAYGGTVEMVNNEFVVVPQDGLRSRVNVVGTGMAIDLRTHNIEEVRIRENKTGVSFTVDNVSRMARESEVTIRGLIPGRYDVIVDGELQETVMVRPTFDRNGLEIPFLFTYESPSDAMFELEIVSSAPTSFTGTNPRTLGELLNTNDVTLNTRSNLGIFQQHSPFEIPVGTTLTVNTALNIESRGELRVYGTLIVAEGGRINNQGGSVGGTIRIMPGGRIINNGHVENVTNSTLINNGAIVNNARFEVRANATLQGSGGGVSGTTPLNINRNAITD